MAGEDETAPKPFTPPFPLPPQNTAPLPSFSNTPPDPKIPPKPSNSGKSKQKSPPKAKRASPKKKGGQKHKTPPRKPKISPTSPQTPPSPSPPRYSSNNLPPSDYKPKFKAEFYIHMTRNKVGKRREKVKAVGDTGCSKSAISEDFFLSSPHLMTRPYRPLTTRGTAINGTKVVTLGIVNITFRINGRFFHQNVRVVRGLIQDMFLGWDWLTRHGAVIDTDKGVLNFPRYGDSTPLVPSSLDVSGCFYRVPDDLVVPANSKAQFAVEVMLDGNELAKTSKIVETEPFNNAHSDVWACRNIDELKECRFLTEVINAHDYPVKLEKGRVLGYANFTTEEELCNFSQKTEMYCVYDPEAASIKQNSGKKADKPGNACSEPVGDARGVDAENDDDDEIEEILCDPPSRQAQKPHKPEPCDPQDTPPPTSPKSAPQNKSIPPGAKPLKLDLSNISKRALPYKKRLKQLLEIDHAKAFSRHDRDYGKTDVMHFKANIKDKSAPPIAVRPYRTNPEMTEAVNKQAYDMIADGLVQHSKSAYSAPILLARKKCGGWRFLTDFRRINERCEKIVFPLPRIEDSLQRLDKPQFFTSLDLLKGFWQLPIHEDDRHYFAFSTSSMHLEYLVAPMGAKNSPSALSALMQLVLRGLPLTHVISYLDDILIATSTMEEHIKTLDKVLAALERAGLKLNPAKCSIAQDSVVCLGHKLSAAGMAPDPANVAKIKAWQAPPNVKKLKTFLGLTGYYRHFVRGYSDIAQPLTDLTHDKAPWVWHKEHQDAFEKLRGILISEQIMSYPDFSLPFVIKSDASVTAVGYVLTQIVDGKERVISYGSKKLTKAQQGWSTYDREFWGLLCGIRANSHYLRHAKFTAITDHRPLLSWRKINAERDPTGRRTRWSIELDLYDFDLIYKAGRIHSDADAMSRLGNENDETAEDDDEALCFLGMVEPDDYGAVKYNAEEEGINQLRQAQNADDIISEAIKFIKSKNRIPHSFPERWYHNNSRWLRVRKGILYKLSYSETAHSQVLQAVIPHSMRHEIMSELHGDHMSGHPCPEKMLLKVRRYAVWPSMNKDITSFVENCKICDQLRDPTPRSVTPRVPLEAKNVWDWVVCDLLMLPVAKLGYHYVCVFIDVFSGFVKLYKLKNKNTEGVCKAFEDLTCLIGPPRLLTSDNGGEFTSELLTKMCEVKGARKRTSVAYRPQSQGNVERFNRTLISALKKRLIQYGKSWPDHLMYVEWAYNTTPRSNSKMTPYHLMYNREPPLPTFVDVDELTVSNKDLQEYFKKVKVRTKEVYDEARRRMILEREKDVEASNRKTKHVPLEPGEKVYELVPESLRHKLQPKWDNLMTVVSRRHGPKDEHGITYVCQKPDGSTRLRHYEQLKRSKVTDPGMLPPLPPPVPLPPVLPVEKQAPEPPPPTPPRPSQLKPSDPQPIDNILFNPPDNPGNPQPILLPKKRALSLQAMAAAFSFRGEVLAPPVVALPVVAPPIAAPPLLAPSVVAPPPVEILPIVAPAPPEDPPLASDPPAVVAPVATVAPVAAVPPVSMPASPTRAGSPMVSVHSSPIATEALNTPTGTPTQHPNTGPPLVSPRKEIPKAKIPLPLDVSSYGDVFENLSDTMFADFEPNVYLESQGQRQRLPQFDMNMSVIPHCSNQTNPNLTAEFPSLAKVGQPSHDQGKSRWEGDPGSLSPPSEPTEASKGGPVPEVTPPVGKGKGKGSGKKSKVRASQEMEEKTKFSGARTRLRARREKEASNVKSGMDKLLSTSRKLAELPAGEDDSDEDQLFQPVFGDFSENDLISNKIAEPQKFDSPPVLAEMSDDIVVLKHNDAQVAEPENVNSRWSFSINPLSYFQRTNPPADSCKVPESDSGCQSTEIGLSNIPISSPQHTSTPNE